MVDPDVAGYVLGALPPAPAAGGHHDFGERAVAGADFEHARAADRLPALGVRSVGARRPVPA